MKRKIHIMDEAFTLILFAVFAICSLFLVLSGAGVYHRVAAGMNEMDAPLIVSYVAEKLRSCGGWEEISVGKNGELLLSETISGKEYVTWIYLEDGYLKETLMPRGREPLEGAGNSITPVENFEVKTVKTGMLEICAEDKAGTCLQRYYTDVIAIQSEEKGKTG